jgi:hypothetical protein
MVRVECRCIMGWEGSTAGDVVGVSGTGSCTGWDADLRVRPRAGTSFWLDAVGFAFAVDPFLRAPAVMSTETLNVYN